MIVEKSNYHAEIRIVFQNKREAELFEEGISLLATRDRFDDGPKTKTITSEITDYFAHFKEVMNSLGWIYWPSHWPPTKEE